MHAKFCMIPCNGIWGKNFIRFLEKKCYSSASYRTTCTQSCSGHSKICKSIKNPKSKILTKPILSSIYIAESNNMLVLKTKKKVFSILGELMTQ